MNIIVHMKEEETGDFLAQVEFAGRRDDENRSCAAQARGATCQFTPWIRSMRAGHDSRFDWQTGKLATGKLDREDGSRQLLSAAGVLLWSSFSGLLSLAFLLASDQLASRPVIRH
jgi:hypothetical protein